MQYPDTHQNSSSENIAPAVVDAFIEFHGGRAGVMRAFLGCPAVAIASLRVLMSDNAADTPENRAFLNRLIKHYDIRISSKDEQTASVAVHNARAAVALMGNRVATRQRTALLLLRMLRVCTRVGAGDE